MKQTGHLPLTYVQGRKCKGGEWVGWLLHIDALAMVHVRLVCLRLVVSGILDGVSGQDSRRMAKLAFLSETTLALRACPGIVSAGEKYRLLHAFPAELCPEAICRATNDV
jgi:hypothetical protein